MANAAYGTLLYVSYSVVVNATNLWPRLDV